MLRKISRRGREAKLKIAPPAPLQGSKGRGSDLWEGLGSYIKRKIHQGHEGGDELDGVSSAAHGRKRHCCGMLQLCGACPGGEISSIAALGSHDEVSALFHEQERSRYLLVGAGGGLATAREPLALQQEGRVSQLPPGGTARNLPDILMPQRRCMRMKQQWIRLRRGKSHPP